MTNTWQQFTVDLKYIFTPKVGFGRRLLVREARRDRLRDDQPPGQPDQPRIDYLGEITTGYGNRPYKGSTFTARLLYTF